jgi:hypothetical protein
MYIQIEYSNERLWGKTDPEAEKLDRIESSRRFSEAIRDRLKKEFSGATISILQNVNDVVKVDGKSDSPEAVRVNEIIQKVWSSWDWIYVQQPEETEK